MSVVAVVSMKGGVGKTSIAANLAAAVSAKPGHRRTIALDLDPQNSLHLHFGLGPAMQDGVCRQSLHQRNWDETVFAGKFGTACLPYGVVKNQEREAFERLLGERPDWIGAELARAGFGADDLILIDTPPGPSVYLKQAFACADLVLIVLLPDAGSYATIPAMESWLDEMAAHRPALHGKFASIFLINQVDEAAPLSRDIGEVLRHQLGRRLAPIGVHRDEAVREALAFEQPVLFYDPHSQATSDIDRLASWMLATLGEGDGR